MVILYADDDSDDREIFAQAIKDIDPDIKIVEAENGLEVMTFLTADILPDLIFLDVNMPLLNGDEALIQIRKDPRLKDLKIVMYSTSINFRSIPDYIISNAAYVSKPTSFIDTVSTLKNLIGKEFPSYVFNGCM